MNNNRLYLDIHALQILPPSCVNRDDTNTPKTCVYGGKTRARVSSQCWKRATRIYMLEHNLEEIGIRTRKFTSCVKKELMDKYSFSEEDAKKYTEAAVKISEVASAKDEAKAVVSFYSAKEIEEFAKVVAENKDKVTAESKENKQNKKKESPLKAQLAEAVQNNPSTDILLFGRMFASNISLNYDAACQVAHAISVNEAQMEYDYFTAVDDIPDEGKSGSGYLDTKQFTDPVFYRYANVNLSDTSELVKYDKANAAKAARSFTEAFILSMPTGSANGYANRTLPDYIMVTLRDDMPVSFAPAFIKPVKSDDFQEEAETKLIQYAEQISKNYGKPVAIYSLKDMSFKQVLESLEDEIKRRL